MADNANTRAKSDRKPRTTYAVVCMMLSWLEIPTNFALITGDAAKGPVVAGKQLKKTDGHQSLADYININFGYKGGDAWTKETAKNRLQSTATHNL